MTELGNVANSPAGAGAKSDSVQESPLLAHKTGEKWGTRRDGARVWNSVPISACSDLQEELTTIHPEQDPPEDQHD